MVVYGPPAAARVHLRTLIARERGSEAGGHVVLSLHVRVSNHVSDPRCSSLSTSFSRAGFRGVGRHRR
jgi:hypothetical protein